MWGEFGLRSGPAWGVEYAALQTLFGLNLPAWVVWIIAFGIIMVLLTLFWLVLRSIAGLRPGGVRL